MNVKFTDPTSTPQPTGNKQAEATLNAQKELLGAYQEASRVWLARMKSEVDLWSGLAARLTETRSMPEAMAAYQECVTQQMKMVAEDAQRLGEEWQENVKKITRALSNG
jgi:hypothetical protein